MVSPVSKKVMTLDKEIELAPEVKPKDIIAADAYVKKQQELLSGPTDAATYYVASAPLGSNANPGTQIQPFLTIQHAVDAANSGDTIQVMPGTYYEHILVADKDIEIIGNPLAPETTVIDGSDNGKCIKFTNSSGRLAGFTVQNGLNSGTLDFYAGAGVTLSSSHDFAMENLIVKDNVSSGAGGYGGGICVTNSLNVIVRDSVVANNRAKYYGGGIFISGSIIGATLTNPTGGSPVFTPAHVEWSTVRIENVVAASNQVTYSSCGISNNGAGIQVMSSKVDIVNSTIVNNLDMGPHQGAGLNLGFASVVNILNTVIWGNKVYGGSQLSQIAIADNMGEPDYYHSSNLSIYNSNVQGGLEGVGTLTAYGFIIHWPDEQNPYTNVDPQFSSVALGAYPPRANSPVLGVGASQVEIPGGSITIHLLGSGSWPTSHSVKPYPAETIVAPAQDISGNQRPGFNAQGSVDANPDMGAYEVGRIGDVNHSGSVNSIDALLAAKYFTGMMTLNPSQQVEADANDDGSVNAIDSLQILKYFTALISTLPYSGP